MLKADVVRLARGVRGRDRQAAAGRGRRSTSSAPASAASPSPTSCSPRRPTRSSSASTSARSATRAQVAEREGVEIRTYSVIYRALDDLRDAMQGMLEPEEVEETVGTVEVRADLPRLARSARSPAATSPTARSRAARRCASSATAPSSTTATIDSLRRFNDDVREVAAGLRVRHRARQLPGRQGGRRARGLRDAAGRARARVATLCPTRTSRSCSIHLHFPDAGSLKAKRKELSSVKAQLHDAAGRVRRRGRPPGHLAALDAGRGARRAARRALDEARRPRRALCSRSASRRVSRVERTSRLVRRAGGLG